MISPTDQPATPPANIGLFLLRPEPGHVIEIHTRCGAADFHFGFCRAVIWAGPYLQFVEGFRRCSGVSLGLPWCEPCDFGMRPREGFGFRVAAKAAWMSRRKPEVEA